MERNQGSSNRDGRKRALAFSILAIVVLFVVILGATYAAFQYTKKGEKENEITTGYVTFVYNETGNGVSITNAFPKSDSEGKLIKESGDDGVANGYFDFNVTSTMGGNMTIPYYVYAVDITGDVEHKLASKYVKLYLSDQEDQPIEGYEGEVPTFASLDPIKANDSNGEEVQGKKLYYGYVNGEEVKKFRLRMWLSNRYPGTEVAETFKLRVDVNTDAEAVEKDTTPPTCVIKSSEPQKVNKDGDLTVTIKCTDDSKNVTSRLSDKNLKVLVGGEEVNPTKKQIQKATPVDGGIEQVVVLSGFDKAGDVAFNIEKGVFDDEYGNQSEALESLSTGSSVNKWLTAKFHKGEGVSEIGEEQLTCDLVDDSSSCQIELPTITTEQEGYSGYWSTDQESGTDKNMPGSSVTITKDEDYYSFVTSKIEVNYEIVGGVSSIGEASNKASCEIKLGEKSCKITLPTITKADGYTGAFWSESRDAKNEKEGKNPGEQVDVSENGKTFYAIGYKTVNVTYTQVGGIQTEGLDTAGSCTFYGEEKNCTVTLPTLTPSIGYTGAFWGENQSATSGKNGGTLSDELTGDKEYFAIGYKEVTATFTPTSGVASVGEAENGGKCTFYGAALSCDVTLPTITGNKGYDQTYWGALESTEYAQRIQTDKVTLTDNTTYYAFAKDIKPPVCELDSTVPTKGSEVELDGTVKIIVNCTDNSGSLANDLTKDNVEVTFNAVKGTATTTVDSGTVITDGKKYTITLTNFSAPGALATTIKAGALKDASNNQMTALPITPGITIKSGITSPTDFEKENKASGSTYTQGNADSHKMFSNLGGGSRYIGDDPYNYVKIDGESSLWRIIGVFNDPVASGESSGKKIKLIRDESIGNYSWDNTTGTSYGSNNWNTATLQKILNSGAYWNKQNGTCSTGTSLGATKACNFSSTGLSSTLKGMIAKMKWYTGGYDWSNYSTETAYTQERGSKPAGASGSTTTWDGYVGLMYLSDYGYTYAKGVSNCYTDFANNSSSACNSANAAKGWIRKDHTSEYQWMLTPHSGSTNSVSLVWSNGYVNNDLAYVEYGVRPVIYLKSSIGITDGHGTSSDPYTIG